MEETFINHLDQDGTRNVDPILGHGWLSSVGDEQFRCQEPNNRKLATYSRIASWTIHSSLTSREAFNQREGASRSFPI
jgi:hypothetical protein